MQTTVHNTGSYQCVKWPLQLIFVVIGLLNNYGVVLNKSYIFRQETYGRVIMRQMTQKSATCYFTG